MKLSKEEQRSADNLAAALNGKMRQRLFLDENPMGGETVTLGDKTFTFVSKVQDNCEILIGATVEETIKNCPEELRRWLF